jgi:hypothetical protein
VCMKKMQNMLKLVLSKSAINCIFNPTAYKLQRSNQHDDDDGTHTHKFLFLFLKLCHSFFLKHNNEIHAQIRLPYTFLSHFIFFLYLYFFNLFLMNEKVSSRCHLLLYFNKRITNDDCLTPSHQQDYLMSS